MLTDLRATGMHLFLLMLWVGTSLDFLCSVSFYNDICDMFGPYFLRFVSHSNGRGCWMSYRCPVCLEGK